MGNGQLSAVDPGMDMLPALFGERPLQRPPARVFQEYAESVAQVARAAARGQSDRQLPI